MRTFDSFESNRWIWRINLALQIVMVVTLAVIVNYIGMKEYVRRDLTRGRSFSLSAETISYIRDLAQPVEIIVTLADDANDAEMAQAFRDVRGILREFSYHARANINGPINLIFLNVYEQRRRAESLRVADKPNAVIFRDPTRISFDKIVPVNEFYQTRNRERTQFVGEKRFASALLDVSSRVQPVLYFLQGHGEMQLTGVDPQRGASWLQDELESRNYITRELDFSSGSRVPSDADMVVVLGPQNALLPAEQEILRKYLDAGAGKLLLALEPGRLHGLDDLLYHWGVLADDVLVIETDAGNQVTGGDLRVTSAAEQHPITQVLADNKIPAVFGLARTARADPGRPLDEALVVSELLRTSESSWGEFGFRAPQKPEFNANRDLHGPLALATAAEKKTNPGVGGSGLRSGRLVAFGGVDFIANRRIRTLGNLTLFLNSVSWLLGEDSRLDIPARPVERLQLTLSQEQLSVARVTILFGPALLVAIIGTLVYVSRRR